MSVTIYTIDNKKLYDCVKLYCDSKKIDTPIWSDENISNVMICFLSYFMEKYKISKRVSISRDKINRTFEITYLDVPSVESEQVSCYKL